MINMTGAGISSETAYERDYSQTHQAVDLRAAKYVVGTKIEPNVFAGTLTLATEITTGAVRETYGIAGICRT